MATLIAINGPAGTGKSFGMRTLDPTKTVCIDSDSKGLPMLGWKKDYNATNKNYFKTDDLERVRAILQGVNDKMPTINCIVIDTNTSIFEKYLYDLRKKPGFDRFKNLAEDVYGLMKFANDLRDDLIIMLLNHTQDSKCLDAEGNETICSNIAIGGAKTTKDATITKLLNFSFFTQVTKDEESGEPIFSLATVTNGKNTARSIHGLFPNSIPNDYGYITDTIRKEYMAE